MARVGPAASRPASRFLYMYLRRLGFLDGVAGFHYCRLLSIYEYMIVMKSKEKKQNRKLTVESGRLEGVGKAEN